MRMTFEHFIKNLVKHHIEFETMWDERGEYYYVAIVLGNREHLICETDTDKMMSVWNEIQEYYL